jgi:hypothetical protein
MRKEDLTIIQKSQREILLILKNDFKEEVEKFKTWLNGKYKYQSALMEIESNESIKAYKKYKIKKTNNMLKVLIDEIKTITSLTFIGEWYNKENKIEKTIIFEKKSNYWTEIILSIWNNFNKIGYNKFLDEYWETYNFEPEVNPYICEYEGLNE